MKDLLTTAILFLSSVIFASAQISYDSLIKNKAIVNVDKEEVLLPTDGEFWELQSFDKLRAILENDLISYFDLSDKYSTPLKKQTFQKAPEYTDSLLPAFNKIRESVKNAKFYTLYNLQYNESYNVTKRCFAFNIGVDDYYTTTTPGYIGLGNCFCISFPQSRTKITKSNTSSGGYFLQQYITTPTIPEEIALRIENEMENPYCSMRLMFIVKPIKVTTERMTMNFGGYVGVQNIVNKNILANTIGMYIVDIETNEVLCDLSGIFSTSATTHRKSTGTKK